MDSSKQKTVRPARADLLVPNPKLRLREQVHEVMRFKHFSVRTEEAYWGWIYRFMVWARGRELGGHPASKAEGTAGGGSGWRHPREMGDAEVHEFLTHLATERDVAVSTQNQALNARRRV